MSPWQLRAALLLRQVERVEVLALRSSGYAVQVIEADGRYRLCFQRWVVGSDLRYRRSRRVYAAVVCVGSCGWGGILMTRLLVAQACKSPIRECQCCCKEEGGLKHVRLLKSSPCADQLP